MFEADKILLRCQEDLSLKIFVGEPLAGTIGGPWEDGWMDGYLERCGGLLPGTQALGSGCSTSQPAACPDFRIWASYSHRPPPPGGL